AGRPVVPRAPRRPEAPAIPAAVTAGRSDVLGAGGLRRLQRLAGNEATTELVEGEAPRSPVLDVVGSGGRPRDGELRTDMEDRLGHDFGDVRLHTGHAAGESARSVGAHAYTVGSDVVFGAGRYDPSSTAGRTMIAHELTHVVQQRSGPVDGTDTGTGVKVSDPADRFEREAAATAEAAMARPPAASPAQPPGPPAPGVQRAEDAEELEEVQGAFVQRQEAAEEELEAPE